MTNIALTEMSRQQILLDAQQKARDLLSLIEKNQLLRIGVDEHEISEQIFELAKKEFGVTKHWHKRIVRTGPNSVLPYKANPQNRTVEGNDLVYVDLGPVFEEFEGDIGKTYLLGKDPDKQRLVDDLERIFNTGKVHYLSKPEQTGAQLYDFIIGLCEDAGWNYGNHYAGHIVGEFSHIHIYGDGEEHRIWPKNNMPMNEPSKDGKPRYWILEIHLVDKAGQYGGFFEDILL